MHELIKINFGKNVFSESTVSAREVYKVLGAKQDFTSWFKYQVKRFGFLEGKDFHKISVYAFQENSKAGGHGGDRKSVDFQITKRVEDLLYSKCSPHKICPSKNVHTYIVEARAVAAVKIGASYNIEERLKVIQAGCPARVGIVKIYYNKGFEFEKFLHNKFEDYRLFGEWFSSAILDSLPVE